MHTEIPSLLLNCERSGLAREYAVGGGELPHVVRYDGEGRQVVLISDLHMAAGTGADGRYEGTENFFCDGAFSRFIDYLRREIAPGNGLLVINGDVIDFLRIIELPESEEDFLLWKERLAEIGIEKTVGELRGSISQKERDFGFKTHDFKSAWRLWRAVEGHHEFFAALARWTGDNQKTVLVKGNHDLEWYWPAVRNALRLEMAKMIARTRGEDLRETLEKRVLPNLDFIDDAVVIDSDLYIEHGHRYDRYTFVLGEPTFGDAKEELNIPFGSFFNRYLVNGLEAVYPYLDNIRPRENLLPFLIRERFPLAIRVLFAHIPFMLRIIPKSYYSYMFKRFLTVALAIVVPVAIGIVVLATQLPDIFHSLTAPAPGPESASLWGRIGRAGLNLFGSLGWLVLSYFLARILARFQLTEPDSLNSFGEQVLRNPDYRIVAMGHTHAPDQFRTGEQWFFNTGTWIPLVETSSAALRTDDTFCFLHLRRNESSRLLPGRLQRWNDAAERADPLTIVRHK